MNKEYELKCKSIFNSVKSYISKDSKIFSLGCNNGSKLFPFLSKMPIKMQGIDIDQNLIDEHFIEYVKYLKNYPNTIRSEVLLNGDINEKFKTNIKLPNWETLVNFPSYTKKIEQMNKVITFKHSSIEEYKFEESFDLIIASNSLHFLPHKVQSEVISKIYACLSSNGIFYFRNNILEKFINEDWETKYEKISDNIFKAKSRRDNGITYYLNSIEELSGTANMFSEQINVTDYIPGKLSNAYVYIK